MAVFGKFADPAIVGGEIERAIHCGGHARGAGGLAGDDGVVQPNVRAVFEEAGKLELVADEDGGIRVIFGEPDEVIEGIDGGVIEGIRLAGPDDLDRVLAIVDELAEEPDITGDQFWALVTGEAAGPDEGEYIWFEKFPCLIRHHAEESFLELALAVFEFLDIAAQAGVLKAVVCPIFFILSVGDVGDFANIW